MSWKTIRLELAQAEDFPNGSAARSYMMRVPLDSADRIDEGELGGRPELATVRRFWPNEPDRMGRLVRDESGWTIDYGSVTGGLLFESSDMQIRLGSRLRLMEPDGGTRSYQVKFCARG